jgi:hypothetical protein
MIVLALRLPRCLLNRVICASRRSQGSKFNISAKKYPEGTLHSPGEQGQSRFLFVRPRESIPSNKRPTLLQASMSRANLFSATKSITHEPTISRRQYSI